MTGPESELIQLRERLAVFEANLNDELRQASGRGRASRESETAGDAPDMNHLIRRAAGRGGPATTEGDPDAT